MSGRLVIRWPDGVEMRADNPGHLLDLIAKVQWDDVDRDGVKHLLSDRAWAWSRTAIDPLAPDARFVMECVRARLFTLSFDARRIDPGPEPE